MPRTVFLAALSAFLVMLGFGVLFPVLPFFSEELGLSKLQYGVLMSAYPFVGMLVGPAWGRFSDRYGRRPAIVLGLIGFGVSFILFGFGQTFGQLLAARALGGLLSAATLPAAFALAADVTRSEQRTAAMGVLGAAIGLGFALGPALGGWLAIFGLRAPYFVSGAIGVIGGLAMQVTLPEGLDEGARTQAREHRAWLERSGVTAARIRSVLMPLLVVSFLLTAARLAGDVTIAFLLETRVGAGPTAVGGLMFAMGMWVFVLQGGGVRPLARRFGDYGLCLFGSGLMGVGLLAVVWAHTWTTLALAGFIVMTGFALHTPTLTALLSQAAEGVQGEAQGLNASAQSLARVVGPVIFAALYDWRAGAPSVLGAALCALAVAVGWRRFADGRRVVPVALEQTG